MKFSFIHIVGLLVVINVSGKNHHKHKSKFIQQHHVKKHKHRSLEGGYLLNPYYNYAKYLSFHDGLELIDSSNYRETDLDAIEAKHHIRHHHDPGNTEIHWPVKKEATVEGDLIIGGLMMVHEREDSVTCGPVMPQGGIQALEAMLFTLDQLNKNRLLPDVKLGAHILDDCDKDTYGLEMAVDFIKGKRCLFPRKEANILHN